MSVKVQGTIVIDNSKNLTVANANISGTLIAAGSTGTSGQALLSTGSGVQWGTVSGGGGGGGFDASSYEFTSNKLNVLSNLQPVAYTGKFDSLSGNIAATNLTVTGSLLSSLNVTGLISSSDNIKGKSFSTVDGNIKLNTTPDGYGSYSVIKQGLTVYDASSPNSPAMFFSGGNAIVVNGILLQGTATLTGQLNAGGSNGSAGQALLSTGSGVKWGSVTNPPLVGMFLENYIDTSTTNLGNLYTIMFGGTKIGFKFGTSGLGVTTINSGLPTGLGQNTYWRQSALGSTGSALAVRSDGTLWAWGNNQYGQLGLGNTTNYSSPVQVGALTNWKQVSTGFVSAAVKTDGTLWTWGLNNYGQLGSSTTTNRSSPVQVGALTNWKQVSVGNSYCAAVKTDGTLWTWGLNTNGNLGLGNVTSYSSPVQVGALTNWKQVAASQGYSGSFVYANTGGYGNNGTDLPGATAAIKTDGTLWTWGFNTTGTLGLSDTTSRSSPVQVGAMNNWKQVSIDISHCAATKTDGTLWAWGSDGSGNSLYASSTGQLGTNSTGGPISYCSSPVQSGGGSVDWKQVSVCAYYDTPYTLLNFYYCANQPSSYNNASGNIAAVKFDGSSWFGGAIYNGSNFAAQTSVYTTYTNNTNNVIQNGFNLFRNVACGNGIASATTYSFSGSYPLY